MSSTVRGSRRFTASAARLLRAHPFEVGIDPSFHELDEEHGAVLRGEAFSRALEAFCAEPDERRLALLATYGSVRLRKMLTGVYSTLRSAGRELVLELGEPADLDERIGSFRDAARSLLEDPGATPNHVAAAQAALDLPSLPETLIDLAALRTRGDRAASFDEARKNLERAALERAAAEDRELLQELLDLFTAEYQAAKERESALDFEDLQIFARNLLAANEHVREAEQLRFRSIMVDEFQDTNALQCGLDRPDRRRRREGAVLRRGRVPVDLRLQARRCRCLPGAAGRGGAAG